MVVQTQSWMSGRRKNRKGYKEGEKRGGSYTI